MDIQKATLEQLIPLNNLFDQYRRFYDKSSDLKKSEQFLKERIERKESEIYISWEGNTATGFVQLFPLFSSTRLARYWLLNDLYVHPHYRGEGISKALIVQAKQLCRDTNACGMYLETGIDNNIGNTLYPAMGFKRMNSVNFYEWSTSSGALETGIESSRNEKF